MLIFRGEDSLKKLNMGLINSVFSVFFDLKIKIAMPKRETPNRSHTQSLIVEWNINGTGKRIISMASVKAKERAMVSRKWFERKPKTSPHTSPGKRKINKLPKRIRKGASNSNGERPINQKKFIANMMA